MKKYFYVLILTLTACGASDDNVPLPAECDNSADSEQRCYWYSAQDGVYIDTYTWQFGNTSVGFCSVSEIEENHTDTSPIVDGQCMLTSFRYADVYVLHMNEHTINWYDETPLGKIACK